MDTFCTFLRIRLYLADLCPAGAGESVFESVAVLKWTNVFGMQFLAKSLANPNLKASFTVYTKFLGALFRPVALDKVDKMDFFHP